MIILGLSVVLINAVSIYVINRLYTNKIMRNINKI